MGRDPCRFPSSFVCHVLAQIFLENAAEFREKKKKEGWTS